MLVIMQAGIDLSTPAVISFGGNLLVGVSVGHDSRLALGILACIGLGAAVGLVNGILVGIVRLNPLIVTLAVGQIVFAWNLRYAREVTNSTAVPDALSSWAGEKPLGISAVFWTGAALTVAVALLLRYTAAGRRFQVVGANPRAAWMAGLRVRIHVVFAYTAAGILYGVGGGPARRHPHQRRPGLRRRLPAGADRRRRHRGRVALRRAGERDVDVGGRARAHVLDADAADPGSFGGDAVHRLRCRDHRRNADLRRPDRLAPRPRAQADRGEGGQPMAMDVQTS